MNPDATLARQVVVEGFVQGVGYRDFTQRAALRLNVSGWVRNRADGAVEALIQGAAADLEAMIAEMRRGPRGANVASLRVAEAEPDAGGSRGTSSSGGRRRRLRPNRPPRAARRFCQRASDVNALGAAFRNSSR